MNFYLQTVTLIVDRISRLAGHYGIFHRNILIFQRIPTKDKYTNIFPKLLKLKSAQRSRIHGKIEPSCIYVQLWSLYNTSGGSFYQIARLATESALLQMKKCLPDLFCSGAPDGLQQAYRIRMTYLFAATDIPQLLAGIRGIRATLHNHHIYLEGRFDPRDVANSSTDDVSDVLQRLRPFSVMQGPAGRKQIDKWIAAGVAAPEAADVTEDDSVVVGGGGGLDAASDLPRALVVLKAAGDVDRALGMAGDELDGRQPLVLLMSRDHDEFANDFFKRGGFPRETVLYFTEIRKHPARHRAAARAARAIEPAFSSDTPAAHLVAAQMKDIVSVYIQADTLDSIIRTWRPEVVIGCFEKTNWVPLLAAGDPRPRIVNLQHGFNPRLHLLDLMDIDSFRVWDQPSADTAIADGIPPERIRIVDNPHRRHLQEIGAAFTGTDRFQQWQDWKAGRVLVAIMGQPDTTGAISPQENRALGRAVGAALKHRDDMVAVLRPHPRQPDATFSPELHQWEAIGRARMATDADLGLGELFALADLTVGIHSTALADAWAIGVPAFAFDFQGRFDALGFDPQQVTQVIVTEREAIGLLKRFGRPDTSPLRRYWARLVSRLWGRA